MAVPAFTVPEYRPLVPVVHCGPGNAAVAAKRIDVPNVLIYHVDDVLEAIPDADSPALMNL